MKLLYLLTFISCIFFCFGDAANRLLSFHTTGPDYYADGSVVLDNEWYALVWSSDGQFNGIDVNNNPIRENDRIILMAPLAENGHCPYTIFQIDSCSTNNFSYGEYAVYILDTRNTDLSKPSLASSDGTPVLINGLQLAANFKIDSTTAYCQSVNSYDWMLSDDTNVIQPVITSLKFKNEFVELIVTNLQSNIKYNVQMGMDLNEFNEYGLSIPQTGDNSVFKFNPKNSNFFRIVRENLN